MNQGTPAHKTVIIDLKNVWKKFDKGFYRFAKYFLVLEKLFM